MTESNQDECAEPILSVEEKLAIQKAKRAEYSKRWAHKKEAELKRYRKEYNLKNKENRKARYERLKNEDPEYLSKQNQLYRQRHPEKIKAQTKQYNDKTKERRALRYQENKELEKIKRKKFYQQNKEIIKDRSKKRYEQNKETVCSKRKDNRSKNKEQERIKERAYRQKNKEVVNERERNYWRNNKEQCIKRNVKYRNERLKRDPLFAAKEKLRRAVRSSFERIKQSKPTNTEKLLGCSWEEAKNHIESLWAEGMSWENHGTGDDKWQIDHIRPVASFAEHELDQMNLISNLQPLWMKDNLLKKDKYES